MISFGFRRLRTRVIPMHEETGTSNSFGLMYNVAQSKIDPHINLCTLNSQIPVRLVIMSIWCRPFDLERRGSTLDDGARVTFSPPST